MYRTTLRFALVPTRDFEEKMEALLEFCEQAEVEDVMFFIAAEELCVGHITIEEATAWTDVILRAKRILKERGILISLNPWCTFAHYDGGRTLKKGQDFRNMVSADGTVASLTVCPLDENWRKYYVELMRFYVKTLEPDVLWFEDDFRLMHHEPIDYGCFCDEHIRLINERLGTNYDLPALRQAIFHDKKARKAFIDVNAFTLEDTLQYLVSHLKEQKTFGLMTGSVKTALLEGRNYEKLYSILAQNGKKPYNRLWMGTYREIGSQDLAWRLNAYSMWYRSLAADGARFVSEMESYPHTLYSKSASYMRYQLLTSAPLCLSGTTLSIFEFNGNGVVNGEKYAEALKEVKPFLSRVEDLGLSPINARGIHVLYNEASPYTVNTEEESFASLTPNDNWWFPYLEMLGIACKYTNNVRVKGKIVAVFGQVLNNYDDDRIRTLFENNFILLNATAVEILIQRGLGELIGAESCEYWKQRAGKYAIEELASDEKVLGVKKLRATAQFFCGDYLNVRYTNADRRVYTNMLNFKEEIVGDGITQSKNALILPYTGITDDYAFPISLICPLREHAIKQALWGSFVEDKQICFVDEPNVCPYIFKRSGKTYIMLVNFGEDDYKHVYMRLNVEFENMSLLTPERNEWKNVGFQYEEGIYRINQDLKARSVVLYAGNTKEE